MRYRREEIDSDKDTIRSIAQRIPMVIVLYFFSVSGSFGKMLGSKFMPSSTRLSMEN
jgi:hypothetical protein